MVVDARVAWISAAVSLAGSLHAQSRLYSVGDGATSHSFGTSVAVRDDFDGDGVPDIVIGDPRFPSPGGNGRVVIASGTTGAILATFVGGPSETIGTQVACAGDLDGDLVPDVIASSSAWGVNTGVVRVFSTATGQTLRTWTGAAPGAGFGSRIAGLGDVNGDGIPDILATAYESPNGSAYVYSGSDGSLIRVHHGSGALSVFEAIALGDIDGDGRGDYAIAHYPSGSALGDVVIHSGASGSVLHTIVSPPGAVSFGTALARIPDLDGDGIAEIVIGAPANALPGRAFIHSLATGLLIRTLQSSSTCGIDGTGNIVASAGDVDLDGLPDVWMGGTAAKYAALFSGATGAELLTVRTGSQCSGIAALASLPDVDGDGRAELVLADPCDSLGGSPPGHVLVYAGSVNGEVGTSACFGDGTGAACPCGNTGTTGAGCRNSTGTGGRLRAYGSTSVTADNVWFWATGIPDFTSGILFVGSSALNGGMGVPQFDGLRCAGGSVRRLGQLDECTGTGATGPGLRPIGQWSSGETRYFQAYYRNNSGPCATGANLTNMVALVFTP